MSQLRCLQLFLLLLLSGQAKSVTFQQSQPKIVNVNDRVEMKCSHNDKDLYVMLWYQQKQNGPLTLMGYNYDINPPNYEEQFINQTKIVRESRLRGALIIDSVNVSDSAVYYCAASLGVYTSEAYFGPGTKLTVLETNRNITAPKVKVLRPSQNECGKRKNKKEKTLLCVVSGFYPDHVSVSWKINRKQVTTGIATDSVALRNGELYNITSRLSVPFRLWFSPGKKFICTASIINGNETVQRSSGVYADLGLKKKRVKYLRITEAAKLSYTVLIAKSSIYGAFVLFLVWRLQRSPGKHNN